MKTVAPDTDSFTFSTAEPTILEIDACEKLQDYRILWFNHPEKKVKRELVDGEEYRFSHTVIVDEAAEQIRVYLYRKARHFDAGSAKKNLTAMLAGKFYQFPWVVKRRADGSERRHVALGSSQEQYEELCAESPFWSERWHACDEAACVDFQAPERLVRDMREGWIPRHRGEWVKNDNYEMQIFKEGDEPWWVHVKVLQEHLDPFTARSLANDVQWVTAEANKLNAAVTEPERVAA